jgi:predicted phage terminase large subunit-like protein
MIALRQKCLDDPCFLGAYVLDYDFLEDPADFHREAIQNLVDQKDFLFLAPRNHIKTTVVDVVGTIWHLLKYPNDRVLIAASTVDNAGLILKEIRHHMEGSQKLHALFPEYKPKSREEEGNTISYTVPCRTRHKKESSIEVAGENTKITGRHYDVIRCSDLVVKENVPPWADPAQMSQTIEWFRTTAALLDSTNPRAHRTIDGTRWHDSDLYGEILRNDEAYAHFKRIVVGIKEDINGDPIPVWSRMGVAVLKQRRAEAGKYLWAANYKNDPLPGDTAMFRREWFHTYDSLPTGPMEIAITIDLAISERTEADRTAIVVSGVASSGDLYILSAHAGRWTPYEIVDRIFDLCAFWAPVYVGIESVAWQKAMLYILDTEMKRRGVWLPVKALMPDGRKERRAWPLSNHAERFGIYVRPDHQELVDELIRFPVGKHDDYVDALAYRAQDLWKPVVYNSIPANVVPMRLGDAADEIIRDMHEGITPEYMTVLQGD